MMDISEGIEIYNEIKEILMNDIGTEDNVPSSISITQLIFGRNAIELLCSVIFMFNFQELLVDNSSCTY